jgi:hypothetical protein
MLPLCHATKGAQHMPGPRCCNNAKGNQEPVSWLTARLGPRKAQIKLREIERFFHAARLFEAAYHQSIAREVAS